MLDEIREDCPSTSVRMSLPNEEVTSLNRAAAPLNTVEGLNKGCYCRTLNMDRLREQLEGDASLAGLAQSIAQTRPHLFSSTVVFVSPAMASATPASLLLSSASGR